MDFIPEKSEIQVSNIEIKGDAVLKSMIRDLGLNKHFQGIGRQDKQHNNRNTQRRS